MPEGLTESTTKALSITVFIISAIAPIDCNCIRSQPCEWQETGPSNSGLAMQNRTASPSNSYDSDSDYSSEEEQERQMAEPEPSTSSEAPFSTQTPARVPPLGIGKLNLTHTQPSASAQARSTHA